MFQNQRLSIARTLLKASPILLLDESTVNLDPMTEHLILDQIFGLAKGQTIFLITHRLVSLEQIDGILVLNEGQIVKRGSHVHLFHSGGMNASMWSLQNRILKDKTSINSAYEA